MIRRLENAGLGFYVKATKQIHKLGMWRSSNNTHNKVTQFEYFAGFNLLVEYLTWNIVEPLLKDTVYRIRGKG